MRLVELEDLCVFDAVRVETSDGVVVVGDVAALFRWGEDAPVYSVAIQERQPWKHLVVINTERIKRICRWVLGPDGQVLPEDAGGVV